MYPMPHLFLPHCTENNTGQEQDLCLFPKPGCLCTGDTPTRSFFALRRALVHGSNTARPQVCYFSRRKEEQKPQPPKARENGSKGTPLSVLRRMWGDPRPDILFDTKRQIEQPFPFEPRKIRFFECCLESQFVQV